MVIGRMHELATMRFLYTQVNAMRWVTCFGWYVLRILPAEAPERKQGSLRETRKNMNGEARRPSMSELGKRTR
jgi:hypothetical protein